jgi:PEGA domain-containing protein
VVLKVNISSVASEANMTCLIMCLVVFTATLQPLWALGQGRGSQSQASSAPVLEDGTPVKLRISRTVSSADAHVGDTVDFEVLEEVRIGNLLLIPKGGVAWGTVTEAQAKRRMARGGKLNINIDSVRLLDGEKAALRAVKEVKGGGHTGAMTGGIVATSLVFFPAAPFFLFMHGKDITIPKGTEVMSYINGNFPIDMAKFQSGEQPSALPVAVAAKPVGNATLDISSTPPNADIELDGSFAGNTPSAIGVAGGEHTVRISKRGYQSWERKIATSSGSVRLEAELEPVGPSQQPETTQAKTVAPSAVGIERAAPALTPVTRVQSSDNKPETTTETAAKPNEGLISVTSTPDGAEIFVDSIGRGHAPVILHLSPGKHSVQLVMRGYRDWASDVVVKANSLVNVTGTLELQ